MRGRLEWSERGLELGGVRNEWLLELVERLVQLSHQRVEQADQLIIVRGGDAGLRRVPGGLIDECEELGVQ